jgi:ATP-dependent 26S proteasome regulatory subunit
MAFAHTLAQALKARIPVLYIESYEEARVHAEVLKCAASLRKPRPVWTWNASSGLVSPTDGQQANTASPARALDRVLGTHDSGVFIFFDLHAYFGTDQRPADPEVVRKVRDAAAAFRQGGSARVLIVVAPLLRIPPELDKVVTLVDFPLPTHDDIKAMLDHMIRQNADGGRIKVSLTDEERENMVQAALGLTMAEAENAFARAMVDDGRLTAEDVRVVLDEKRQTIRKSGLLDYVDQQISLDEVGGLNNLKRWLGKRKGSWLEDAAGFGLPTPKGVLITGVPGCGKSLTAKAMASAWGLPLLRMDIGRVFAGLVGSSEQNMRNAIATAEAISPCILWIDEIEKGFAGTTGEGDSGTAARVFASFLTWMQEKQHPVFVVATANNIDRLPPEFMRKGRFDEIFFVDLPTEAERQVIWEIQMRRRATGLNKLEAVADDPAAIELLTAASADYSGAEIEQTVIAALFEAYAESRPVRLEDLKQSITQMIPLAVTQAEEVAVIRQWAALRAVAATGSEDREDSAGLAAAAVSAGGAGGQPAVPTGPPARGGRTVDF